MARAVSIQNDGCVHGCNCVENEIHVFFKCEVVRKIWFVNPWDLKWDTVDCNDLMFFLKCLANPVGVLPVHEKHKEKFFLFSAITPEHLWWLRKVFHESKVTNFDLSPSLIRSRFNEISKAHLEEIQVGEDQATVVERNRICSPPAGVLKLNVDVAMRTDKSFLAVVGRDNEGQLLLIQAFQSKITIPEVAELEVIGKAIQVALAQGWSKVIIESDALIVVKALHTKDKSLFHWTSNVLFDDIVSCSSGFAFVNFVWASRLTNILAHNICQ